MFRMIEALEAAGHTCVVYLYDRFDGRLGDRTSVIRQGWPSVRAEIRDIADGVAHLDAWVATGWASAHVLGSRITMPTRRFYFVQDYEPWFYAHGSEFALAEDTYRFGFRCITVGQMVADVLSERFGIDAAVAHFGVDTDVYRMTNRGSRTGVVFYAKPDVARRGYVLGALALGEFHRRHPEQPIHMFGEPPDEFVNFPVVAHGKVSPGELNELYNQTIAGLAMSFTNVSLIPDEMLASGNVPVVNESPYPRASLSNAHVVWARPTPAALSDALCAVVESDDVAGRASRAAADVPADAWRPAQAAVVSAIEDEVYG